MNITWEREISQGPTLKNYRQLTNAESRRVFPREQPPPPMGYLIPRMWEGRQGKVGKEENYIIIF